MLDRIIRMVNTSSYNNGSWLAWKLQAVSEKPGFWDEYLFRFINFFPTYKRPKILEIGPGAGIEAEYLLKMLENPYYHALEPSYTHYTEVYRRVWEAGYVPYIYIEPVEEIEKIEELNDINFDALFALNSLLHMRKSVFEKTLLKLRSKLSEGAALMISMIEGTGQGFHQRNKTWYSYYREDELNRMYRRAGFRVIEDDRIEVPHKTYLIHYLKA